MSSTILFENIRKSFLLYETYLKTTTSLGLTDDALFAENHMLDILQYIFGWKLVNANAVKKNQKGYDLADPKKGIYIQITANRNYKVKAQKAADSFKTIKGTGEHCSFYIVFLSTQVPKAVLDSTGDAVLQYRIYSIAELLENIKYLSAAKMGKIERVLANLIQPLNIHKAEKRTKKIQLPKQLIPAISPGIYINREKMTEELFLFSQRDSGLLTGGAGYGKSFIMEELQRKYISLRIPCFIIRINEMSTGSSEEIARQLGEKKWMQALKTLNWDGEGKALLIFDAFDTAKSDTLKREVLQHIREAMSNLGSKWNILASSRIYDAAKSSTLQSIFPTVNLVKDICCRSFYVPDLTDTELDQALISKNLKETASGCAPGLQKLLKIPYFLKLFEDILSTGESAIFNSSAVETEEDLLNVFWLKKVEKETSHIFFLKNLTVIIVKSDSLVCDKLSFITKDTSDDFDSLVSLNVLRETSMGRDITYYHNILAEYAVCQYILNVRINAQIQLIESNPELIFHFRQSFIYFYSRMWKMENKLFWEHYNGIKSDTRAVFKLVHHTILNYIVINSYKVPAEILQQISKQDENYGHLVLKTLQSIRFIRKGNFLAQDLDLFLEVSRDIQMIYLSELGSLLELAMKFSKEVELADFQDKAGRAAVLYMEFILEQRKINSGSFIDFCGAAYGVPNIVGYYQRAPDQCGKLIGETLEILKEEDFFYRYFYNLAEVLPELAASDVSLSVSIYRTLYYHNENSTKQTSMGGSTIMNLMSNRRQDYQMVHYLLETKFAELLALDFNSFAALGLDIVNKYCSAEGYSWLAVPSKINAAGGHSFIKYDKRTQGDTKENGPSSFAGKIFDSMQASLSNGDAPEEIKQKLHLIIRKGGASKIWRMLLKFLKQHVQYFTSTSFDILENKGIYECEETIHEAGELLKAVWPAAGTSRREKIEQVIHNLTPLDEMLGNLYTMRIRRLLSCIPAGELVLEESIKFIKDNGSVENLPVMQEAGIKIAQPYIRTAEEKILYAGFDPEQDTLSPVYSQYTALLAFNSKFENNAAGEELKKEYKKILKILDTLFLSTKQDNFRSREIKESCDFEISRCSRIISGADSKLSAGEQSKIRKVAFFYIQSVELISPHYIPGELKRSFFKGSGIRGEAVKTLFNLFTEQKNSDLSQTFEELVSDNHPDIRYKAIRGLPVLFNYNKEKFWEIITQRILLESDGLCIEALCEALDWDAIIEHNAQRSAELSIALIGKLALLLGSHNDVWNIMARIQLKIALRHSYELSLDILNKGAGVKEFSRSLVFIIRCTINAYQQEVNFAESLEKSDVFFGILHKLLNYYFNEIQSKGLQNIEIKDDLEVIDHIVSNLNFAFTYSEDKVEKRKEFSKSDQKALYKKIKPLLNYIVQESLHIENGFMAAHTGYYFMQLLNKLLPLEPGHILSLANSVTLCSSNNNFSYDPITFREVVRLTEAIIADYKIVLKDTNNLIYLMEILELFTASGFEEAVELTWQLKEAF